MEDQKVVMSYEEDLEAGPLEEVVLTLLQARMALVVDPREAVAGSGMERLLHYSWGYCGAKLALAGQSLVCHSMPEYCPCWLPVL